MVETERKPSNYRWQSVVPVGLGLAFACLALFSWLAEEVLERHTQEFDNTVRATVHQHASPALTGFMRGVTHLGDWTAVLPAVLLLWGIFSWRGARDYVRLLLLTVTGAQVLDSALKLVFQRTRPDPFFIAKPQSSSFPSGHSLISLCFYGLLAGMLTPRLKKRWQRVAVWAAAALVVGMIGLSRVYLGVHWPSDVLAGYAAAIVWMGTVRRLAPRGSAPEFKKR
jgi:undecaprenyl-diphosphatase